MQKIYANTIRGQMGIIESNGIERATEILNHYNIQPLFDFSSYPKTDDEKNNLLKLNKKINKIKTTVKKEFHQPLDINRIDIQKANSNKKALEKILLS